MRDKAVTHYYQVLAAWEKQPSKIPTWVDTVEIDGREEHNNAFWGMYGPGFRYLKWYNVMLVNNEAIDAAQILNHGQLYRLPPGMLQRSNPHGFPMTPHEARCMVGEIRGNHP